MLLRISKYSQENTCVGVPFKKIADLQACDFIKKRPQHRRFPVNIAKFLITSQSVMNRKLFSSNMTSAAFNLTDITYITYVYYIYSKIYSSMSNCPAGNYMFKVNNRSTITRCKICSKLTIKTPELIEHIEHI